MLNYHSSIAKMRETPMTTQNLPEYSVSELSRALKGTVEDAYSYVRVRGEVSGKRAGSGHLYLTLKDDAVIDGVKKARRSGAAFSGRRMAWR